MEMLYGPHCLRKNAPPTVLMVSLNFLSVYLWSSDVFPTFMSPSRTTLTSGFFIFDTSGMMLGRVPLWEQETRTNSFNKEPTDDESSSLTSFYGLKSMCVIKHELVLNLSRESKLQKVIEVKQEVRSHRSEGRVFP